MSEVRVTREHRERAAQLTVRHSVPKHLVEEWKGRDAPLPQHIVDIGYFDPLLATAQALAEAEERGAKRERADATAYLRHDLGHDQTADDLEAQAHVGAAAKHAAAESDRLLTEDCADHVSTPKPEGEVGRG